MARVVNPPTAQLPSAAEQATVEHQNEESALKNFLREFLDPPSADDELGWLAHYRVTQVLGQGGMGVVLRAEDTHLQRPVALKVMLPAQAANATARERFLREARAVARLHNDHIITIYQVSQQRDIPYLAMEFLRGQSLETRLDSGHKFEPAEIARIGREIALGLAAAHENGMIHRDVKPANIWLEEGTGRVRLLDFGLARSQQEAAHLTQTGIVVGTPYFMSPEQARGETLDVRSDLFSLGAVLYVLGTGRLPFEGSGVMAVLTALAVTTPPPMEFANPDLPRPLIDVVNRLLQKDPACRPASALEVAEALRTIEAPHIPSTPTCEQRITTTSAPALTLPSPPTPPRQGSSWWMGAAAFGLVLVAGFVLWASGFFSGPSGPSGPPILLGVLHSQTGPMAISERSVIDAIELAVDDINRNGGVLGRPVKTVVADGQSDERVFAEQAEKLIQEDKVATIIGCWTSASRKAVKVVVEKHQHLLIYPVSYEGMELSPNIIYAGGVPNQQVLPSLSWLVGFKNTRKWFLVGSDYVFPRAVNEVIKDEAKARRYDIVGEEYMLLGSTDVAAVVAKIAKANPDLIINSINGDTNVPFFRALRKAGISSKDTPTLSFSVSEEELNALAPREIEGDYVAGNYIQSVDTPANKAFLQRFRARFSAQRNVSDPMETAYYSTLMWADAVNAAGKTEPLAIRDALKGREINAPQGHVRIDPDTQHTVQLVRIGQFVAGKKGADLREVYISPQPLQPEPFPSTRSRAQWEQYVDGLYKKWGGRWANVGP